MNNEDKIFWLSWCIEEYAADQHLRSCEVATLFSDANVFEFLDQNAEILHTQGKSYILKTIQGFMENSNKSI